MTTIHLQNEIVNEKTTFNIIFRTTAKLQKLPSLHKLQEKKCIKNHKL